MIPEHILISHANRLAADLDEARAEIALLKEALIGLGHDNAYLEKQIVERGKALSTAKTDTQRSRAAVRLLQPYLNEHEPRVVFYPK